TKLNVFLHPPIVEHFGVIADGCEPHAGLLKDSHQSLKRFLPIRKSAMYVKYALCEHLDLKHLPRHLEHFFDLGGNLRLLNVLRFMRHGPQAHKSQVQNFDSCDRRCKDHPGHTNSFVDAHFPLRKIQLTLSPSNLRTMRRLSIYRYCTLAGKTIRFCRFDELLVPGFEHDQRPDLLITGELTFFLSADNPFNGLRIEIFPACRTAGEQRVAHKLAQLGAEPRGRRHRESLLRSMKY